MNNKKSSSFEEIAKGFTQPHILSGMPADTPILVAFSGGSDSRVLLDLICKYGKQNGAPIYAAHVNHGIRGEEADRDEEFCRRKALEYGIKFFSTRIDVPKIAKESGKSIELAARDERYSYFARLMKEHAIPLLAVAHNANDNLETILFNLARGSGLSGMCGIPPVRECEGGMLIRPVLAMDKDAILEYCEQNKLDFVTDSTNLETEYSRNKIRSKIVPELRALNSSVVKGTLETSELLRRDSEYLLGVALDFLKENRQKDGSCPLDALNRQHPAVLSRIIIKMYSSLSSASLSQTHISDVMTLCKKALPHSRISLPDSVWATIERGCLIFTRDMPTLHDKKEFFIKATTGNNPISQINAEIIIGNTHNEINIYKKSIQFYIDSAKICGDLVLRSRRQQDKILLGAMHKSVKKLMCDKKIALDERYRLPLICDDSGIVAIPFVGIKDGCKSSPNAKNSISIKFYLY